MTTAVRKPTRSAALSQILAAFDAADVPQDTDFSVLLDRGYFWHIRIGTSVPSASGQKFDARPLAAKVAAALGITGKPETERRTWYHNGSRSWRSAPDGPVRFYVTGYHASPHTCTHSCPEHCS